MSLLDDWDENRPYFFPGSCTYERTAGEGPPPPTGPDVVAVVACSETVTL